MAVGTWPANELPGLNEDTCRKTSEARNAYNCIAWATGDSNRWWWPIRMPGVNYWPKGAPREVTIDAFIAAYATCGYAPCADGSLEEGLEKVVLYAKVNHLGDFVPTHAARQLEAGEWSSKLGRFEDISHPSVDAVNGPVYGSPVQYLSRPRQPRRD